MFETRNTRINAVFYTVTLIGLIGMILWFGIFPAWLSGVFSGAGLFGMRPDTMDYLMVYRNHHFAAERIHSRSQKT